MSTKLRLATFNCENLFARFRFQSRVDPENASKNGFTINNVAFEFLDDDEKKLTAKVIKAVDADVIALQEVENFDVMKRFRSKYLKSLGYAYGLLIDGNDPRFIDVAVLSRHPLVNARSYQHLRSGNSAIFSRDCLEVDMQVGNKTLTLFVNHLKSMLDKADPANGRKNTRDRRMLQAKAVKQIVVDRFGAQAGDHPFVVLGDFNDYLGAGQGTTDGISALVSWKQVENVIDRLPAGEQWTHFFEQKSKKKNADPEFYKQLDYLLVSKSLAAASSGKPEIERRGLCLNAVLYTGKRFPGVGDSRPAASDHCPQAFDIQV